MQDGVQARGRAVDPHSPQQTKPLPTTATGFLRVLWNKKRGGNPLASWAKATPYMSQAIVQLGSQKDHGNT